MELKLKGQMGGILTFLLWRILAFLEILIAAYHQGAIVMFYCP